MPDNFNTPILMIVFNRPETTAKVFEQVKAIKPKKLYVAADGPRPNNPNDLIKCQETRNVVNAIDWDCDLHTLFQTDNLNCGKGPMTAINWFFEHEENGIIIEDDCVPALSFFKYCEELLQKYKDHDQIMMINGFNFYKQQPSENESYYFSKYGHPWGWATWRRAWLHFDYYISDFEIRKKEGYFKRYFESRIDRFYRVRKFQKAYNHAEQIDFWDYQWDYARFVNNGLTIIPKQNLVQNIGFGEHATHTINSHTKRANMKGNELEFPLIHPANIEQDTYMDKQYLVRFYKDKLLSNIKGFFG